MKLSILFLGLTISIGSIASELDQHEVAKRYVGMAHAYDVRVRKEAVLQAAAKRYVGFLEQFGAQDQGDIKALMASLFADDCQKVVNGKVIAHNVYDLYQQMAQAKEVVGTWSVELINPIVVNIDSNIVVIHYEISTQEAGTFLVMKFLAVDNGFITDINEVYNALHNIAENLHKVTG